MNPSTTKMAPAIIIQWGYCQSNSKWSILAIAPSLVISPSQAIRRFPLPSAAFYMFERYSEYISAPPNRRLRTFQVGGNRAASFPRKTLSDTATHTRSADSARSLARVSEKREYFKCRPETIGDFAPKLFNLGSIETESKFTESRNWRAPVGL